MQEDLLTRLFEAIELPLSEKEKGSIERAFLFAAEKHRDQKRNSGEPYFIHVVAVAENCARLGMDSETIIGALLHDVLEDTATDEAELRQAFGETIVFLVKGVTKLGHLKYRGQERHVESMRKFFVAMAEDVRVLIIKLADRLHNVETLIHVPIEKQKRIALETIQVHAALAGRLGMEKLKGLLEDYAFPFAYPKEYVLTKKIMDEIVPEAQKVADSAHAKIEETLKTFDLKQTEVHSRVKATLSTYKKLLKYNMNTELVYDIVALRIITHSVTDCYQVLGLIHMLWKPIPKRIKDFISLPKPNGYQSLHTTVVTEEGIIEVQIRTLEMHHEAELGIASHLAYKEEESENPRRNVAKNTLSWLDELKELNQVVGKPSAFLKQLHMDLFQDRIFVFTPKGDVIDLPEAATPVDFAYAIHSEIGSSTGSARINGKLVALSTKLHNGDIVEIITQKNARPTSKWLEYAKTALARRRIRAYITEHGGLLERFLVKE